jgi:uncharacterized protein YeaO (DUF488 family)
MTIRIVRLGTPREPGEGLRLGTVRRPPRGVKKSDYAAKNYYDAWMPELAPSAELVAYAYAEPWSLGRWAAYARRYRSEMKQPAAQHLIAMLASLSHQTNLSVGCYCENEYWCHRALLRELLVESGADVAPGKQASGVPVLSDEPVELVGEGLPVSLVDG